MVKTKNLTLMVTAAVLAALTCVATMVVQIPMPLTKGYVNLGDVMVLTSVWLIGSPWGVAAAGIGSAMADLLTGYAYYAPATLIIKALMAVAAFYIAKCFMNGLFQVACRQGNRRCCGRNNYGGRLLRLCYYTLR